MRNVEWAMETNELVNPWPITTGFFIFYYIWYRWCFVKKNEESL